MRVIGMLRVRNESRWIGDVLDALKPACRRVLVMDDRSTDNTVELCLDHGAEVLQSPFNDPGNPNEGRDKNWLLSKVQDLRPDWVVHIDGDEILEPGGADRLLAAMTADVDALQLPIVYLWDRRDQMRVDGVYGRFFRGSAFRFQFGARFPERIHCSSVPTEGWQPVFRKTDTRLLHLGYLHREDRIRKYHWYNEIDPDNVEEDRYRHVVQGDIPEVPDDARLRLAGPLQLAPLRP